jgi:hypothetical protein
VKGRKNLSIFKEIVGDLTGGGTIRGLLFSPLAIESDLRGGGAGLENDVLAAFDKK